MHCARYLLSQRYPRRCPRLAIKRWYLYLAHPNQRCNGITESSLMQLAARGSVIVVGVTKIGAAGLSCRGAFPLWDNHPENVCGSVSLALPTALCKRALIELKNCRYCSKLTSQRWTKASVCSCFSVPSWLLSFLKVRVCKACPSTC
jgi:hypothetical protein